MKSTKSSYCPIDGDSNPYLYWYSIGAKVQYNNELNCFTGPGTAVQKVYLWMRVGFIKCTQNASFYNPTKIYLMSLLLFVIFS